MRSERRGPSPDSLGDLQLWTTFGEDGKECLTWAASTTDPAMQDAVEEVKEIMRDCGWIQLAGD